MTDEQTFGTSDFEKQISKIVVTSIGLPMSHEILQRTVLAVMRMIKPDDRSPLICYFPTDQHRQDFINTVASELGDKFKFVEV